MKDLLLVEWDDASSPVNIWVMFENIRVTPVRVVSVGFLFHEDETHITLMSSLTEDAASGVITIPKALITRRKKLKI